MKLKPGVSISYKAKKYKGEIPDDLFDEIYGIEAEKKKEKFQFVESKKKGKSEPAKSSG